MTKSEPKLILNLTVENSEVEEKVQIAIDKYVQQLVVKDLDSTIARIVEKRINSLIDAPSWSSDRKIQGVTLEQFVKDRTEQALINAIDEHAHYILAKKLASLI